MTLRLTKNKLQELAAECGIVEIGVTDATSFPELIPWLKAYEERGRTGFEASNIDDRVTPNRWLEEVQSIVVISVPYMSKEAVQVSRRHPQNKTYGITSIYTYGTDYHILLRELFDRLHSRMEETVGQSIVAKLAIDTAPLVDRRIAERAGIGWIGKNAMFYSHQYGSFVYLGAMLTDVVFEDTNHVAPNIGKYCGTCNNCLTACPTGAIISPGVIDATRCLSYVTQMKGMIPLEFRKKLGRRVWGCDVCQRTCPINREVKPAVSISYDEALPSQMEMAYPDLIGLLSMSNKQFLRKYGKTAVSWRGVRTLQRNALIALGNIGCAEAIEHIIPFLQSQRQELRCAAAWALGEIGGSEAEEALVGALQTEADCEVVQELHHGLEACRASL